MAVGAVPAGPAGMRSLGAAVRQCPKPIVLLLSTVELSRTSPRGNVEETGYWAARTLARASTESVVAVVEFIGWVKGSAPFAPCS